MANSNKDLPTTQENKSKEKSSRKKICFVVSIIFGVISVVVTLVLLILEIIFNKPIDYYSFAIILGVGLLNFGILNIIGEIHN